VDARPGDVDVVLVARWEESEESLTAGYDDWWESDAAVIPLHPLPSADEGRVKAMRKLAVDGTLPPILLWWVGGLAAYCVMDGHARLIAARAVPKSASFLILSRVERPEDQPERERFYLEKIERLYERGRGDSRHAQVLAELLGAAQLRREEVRRTVATPLSGGRQAWDDEVRAAGGDVAAIMTIEV